MLDFAPEEIYENLAKLLAMGKERYFGFKIVRKGRNFHSKTRTLDLVKRVFDLLNFQRWRGGELFLDTSMMVYETKVVEFYVNLNVLEDNFSTSSVKEVELVFHHVRLGGEGRALNRNDMVTKSMLANCRLLAMNDHVPIAPPRATSPFTSLLNYLYAAMAQNAILRPNLTPCILIWLNLRGNCLTEGPIAPITREQCSCGSRPIAPFPISAFVTSFPFHLLKLSLQFKIMSYFCVFLHLVDILVELYHSASCFYVALLGPEF
ncbi:hypothetical protein H5410_050776 [Solanum commersonii]|uniref:Uncharacterized protein n=1 Tax=Solanum commersonii TaxID=4109 RepID=A0A9J5WY27_SOLCO|nr:hypothetical protein H5410_050776 [Solanum commersonii]